MVTRSQSAKRKAEDAGPSQPHPKSTKSSSSDDSTSSRRELQTIAEEDKAVNDPEGESNGPTISKTPAQQPSETQPSPTRKGEAQNASRKSQEPAASSTNDAHNDNAEEKQQRVAARSFIAQLQIVLERWRVRRGAYWLPLELEKQRKGLRSLWARVLEEEEEDVTSNPHLEFLPVEWWRQINDLNSKAKEAGEASYEQDEAAARLAQCVQSYETAVGKHGDVLVGHGDGSDENKKLILESISAAEEEMSAARARYGDAKDKSQNRRYELEALAQDPLRTAEEALVAEGYLRPQRKASPEASRRRQSSTSQESQPIRSRHTTPEAESSSDRGTSNRRSEREDLVQEFRNGIRDDLEASQLAWVDAAKRFDAVRKEYRQNLHRFKRRKARGQEVGTRTEFDLVHYLKVGKASRDYAMAETRHFRDIAEAARIGELSADERVRLFGDEKEYHAGSEKGSEEGSEEGDFVVLAENSAMPALEAWLLDDRLDETRSEQCWHSMLPPLSEGVESLDSLSALERRDALADNFEGRRKQIDDYGKMQERLRKRFTHVAPHAPPKEVELQWFEGWGGL